ncbi:putative L-gulonolactone oxidase 6 [Nicotiana tabacum]|uniref:putative L-gulonolactone oxidase 6 n=1 Tax=Nicotiana tabacum TaxID=4097 RepID=UPI003F4E7B07
MNKNENHQLIMKNVRFQNGVIRQILTSNCIFLIMIFLVEGTLPQDPIKCTTKNSNCTITNIYGSFPDRSICRAAEVTYPTTEEELISAVGKATKEKRKMRVATRYSQSIPKLVCPGEDDGLIISTKLLDKVQMMDRQNMKMRVDSGLILKDLIDEAARVDLALPHSPYWWGMSVGGLLGTGVHGSSLWGLGSAVNNYVVELRIVTPATEEEGYAKVRTLDTANPEFYAAKLSLGVLGVISQVTFKLQPMFKRNITFVEKSDSNLGDEVITFGRKHEFADFSWFPSQKTVLYRIDNRVPLNISGNALNDYLGFRPTSPLILSSMRSSEETQEALRDSNGKCLSGKLTKSLLDTAKYGYTNNGILFTGYPLIGPQNRLQASGSCLINDGILDDLVCPWDPRIKGLFFHQTTFSIGLSKVKNFIQDVQKLVVLQPKALCGLDLYSGILMRYVTASNAYLGHQEDAVDFDITYYRSKNPLTPRLYEDILEEIEQMAMFKYGAEPHWGKNRNVAFIDVIKKYKDADKFLKVKETYDPLGLFSNDWTDQILGLRSGLSIVKEGCALEGLCICSEDSHCAPTKGYFCKPGKVYVEARVCTLLSSNVI